MDNLSLFLFIFGMGGRNSILDFMMIFGAEYLIYLALILIFVLAYKGSTKERKVLILAVLALPIAVILIKFIHLFYIEPRPFVAHDLFPLIGQIEGATFPSRHASIMSTLTFPYILFKSKWAYLFIVFSLWVGISRIFVGVHYPLDILGGVIVGFISAIIGRKFLKFLRAKLF